MANPQHSFFKVFIGNGGPAHPFLVPPSYVEALGGALPGEYTLEGPTGERRVVEVKNDGSQWFFREGWGPFMADHSLRYGDILIFTLHGRAQLHFQVYDRNGYLKESNSLENQVKVEGSVIEISTSSEEEEVVCCKRTKKGDGLDFECKPEVQGFSSLRAKGQQGLNDSSPTIYRKRVRFMDNRRSIQDNLCGDSVSLVEKLHCSRQSSSRKSSMKAALCRMEDVRICKEMNNRSREERVDVKVVSANRQSSSSIYTNVRYSNEQKATLIHTAQRLKFGRPLAAVILSPANAQKGIMYFPRPFFQTFFHDELQKIGMKVVKNKGRLITSSGGKTWHVNLLFSNGFVRASAGWHAFVCENGLTEGDFCFFEFITTRPVIELRVSTSRPLERSINSFINHGTRVYSGNEDEENEETSTIEISSSSSDSQSDSGDESIDEEVVVCCEREKKNGLVNEEKTDELNDECKPVIRAGSSFKRELMNVSSPKNWGERERFLKKRRKIHNNSAKSHDNLRKDSVSPVEKLHCSRQSHHHKSSMMPKNCPKKDVRMRKEMKNRLIKREEGVDIKVVSAYRPSSSTIFTSVHYSNEQKARLIRTAQGLKIGRPLAAVILSSSYAEKGIMHFPRPFFQTFFHDELLRIGMDVVKKKGRLITSSSGQIWHINLLFSKGIVRATAGWRAFVCENGLREGDLCFFEFITTRPVIELRVSTSRPLKSYARVYSRHGVEENEESSKIEITNSSYDSQNDTCHGSSDEEVVVCCKRAKKTDNLDDDCMPVIRAYEREKLINVSSARISGKGEKFLKKRRKIHNNSAKSHDNFRRDSARPDKKLHSSGQSDGKNSSKPNLYPKNEGHLDEEMKDRSIKRGENVNVSVVANRQPSSLIYTMVGYSHEQRDKLVRMAQKLKLGRPLAVVSLSPSAINCGYLYFPCQFFRTFFSDLLKISARPVKKRGRLLTYLNGEIWDVEFHFHEGQVRMVRGWLPFSRHNCLAKGDVCVFEFIKTCPLIELRVSTSRSRNKITEDDL